MTVKALNTRIPFMKKVKCGYKHEVWTEIHPSKKLLQEEYEMVN
jgi:hypothetical protein